MTKEREKMSADAHRELFAELHRLLRDRAGLAPHEALEVVLSALEVASGPEPSAAELLKLIPSLDEDIVLAIAELFRRSGVGALDEELRGPAFLHFIAPELRRGLGIFLTPESLARALSRAFKLRDGMRVFDPACGAGALLRPLAERAQREGHAIELEGGDVNEALLRLAALSLGEGFRALRLDALAARGEQVDEQTKEQIKEAKRTGRGGVDLLLSNPPFGVLLDPGDPRASSFETARALSGKLPFELLFIERAIELLAEEGRAMLLLPRSVLTNSSFERARAVYDRLAIPEALISLPSETFAEAGAGVSSIALFLRKRDARAAEAELPSAIPYASLNNIGRDRAGRFIEGSELEALGDALEALFLRGALLPPFERLEIDRAAPFTSLARALTRPDEEEGVPLSELVSLANTGKTPARAAYQPSGAFIIKVGNLTGEGIDFTPRDRNHIRPESITPRLRLEPGDLLLTSTAHHPKYIAEKVDLFEGVPESEQAPISFVGELMRLRPRRERIEPITLLAILRHPSTRERIRARVHGQTAHLRPRDLLEVRVDESLATAERIEALREELSLAKKRNALRIKLRALFRED